MEELVPRHRSMGPWSVVAAWIGWPILLRMLCIAALWLWLVLPLPSRDSFGAEAPRVLALQPIGVDASVRGLSVLAVALAVVVGPPIAITAAWLRGRRGDRE